MCFSTNHFIAYLPLSAYRRVGLRSVDDDDDGKSLTKHVEQHPDKLSLAFELPGVDVKNAIFFIFDLLKHMFVLSPQWWLTLLDDYDVRFLSFIKQYI